MNHKTALQVSEEQALERLRKRRTDELYAKVKNYSPALYNDVVAVASVTGADGLDLNAVARLEARIMALVASALGL